MKVFLSWLEEHFAPRAQKVSNNIWVATLKESIFQVLPFILLGSVFAMLAVLGDVNPWFFNFWTLFGWTMGIISLLIAFLIPFNLMEKKRLRKQRIIAGLTGSVAFLIIVTPQLVVDGAIGVGHGAFGAEGMFVAIVAGVLTGIVMTAFGKFSFFKETSAIPDFVRAWFDQMLPLAVVIVPVWLIADIFAIDIYNALLFVFMPLQNVIEHPVGFIIFTFIQVFLYSMGISPWVLAPVSSPVMLAAIVANMESTGANIVTGTAIYSSYLWIGGIGATLPLVFMMIRSKAKKLSAVGRASLLPGILNINEPVVFGAIVWNPILMIPMWIQGIILPFLMWFFTVGIPFAPIPMVQFEMWYTPFPISTWLTTQSIMGLALFLIIFVVASLIWYPFLKIYEKQELAAELATNEAKNS